MKEKPLINVGSTEKELQLRERFFELFKSCPIFSDEILSNLGLFLNRQTLSRILYMQFLYSQILNIHGIIIEFGVRWGQNLALFSALRGIYEPFNYMRKIVGFDTFEGYPNIHPKDGKDDFIRLGAYTVTKDYEKYLEQILSYHEQESPIPQIKKFEIIKGDATLQIDKYIKNNPETTIALAFFDLDLYTPTLKCLKEIKAHLTKGCVIGFDDLGHHSFPGVTLALKEVLGLDNVIIRRVPYNPNSAYIIIGESI